MLCAQNAKSNEQNPIIKQLLQLPLFAWGHLPDLDPCTMCTTPPFWDHDGRSPVQIGTGRRQTEHWRSKKEERRQVLLPVCCRCGTHLRQKLVLHPCLIVRHGAGSTLIFCHTLSKQLYYTVTNLRELLSEWSDKTERRKDTFAKIYLSRYNCKISSSFHLNIVNGRQKGRRENITKEYNKLFKKSRSHPQVWSTEPTTLIRRPAPVECGVPTRLSLQAVTVNR